ncbi:MAG: Do family serine endopeptidase [Alphaproteobacteria bacterium]|nr:Do family serine endopeptidase [Alphaproteobacteria bacterium]
MRRMGAWLVVAVVGWAGVAGAATAPLPSLAPMIKQVTPAVVNVAVKATIADPANPLFADPFFRNFFGLPDDGGSREVTSAGSGVIIDADQGLIVTNHHVINGADVIRITLRDQRSFAAELVGTDPETDIAVLRIPAEGLTAIPIGDSDALEVGDFVLAIGNPFGIGQTVTLGIVSALGRGLGLEVYEDFIQTDASINPGNSGGALVNMAGELVGINTAILGRGGSIGIGFAIPVTMVRGIAEQIALHGSIDRGQLGVRTQDLTPDLAQGLGLASTAGALVVAVKPGSPADQAGLQPGDLVIGANGRAVDGSFDLRNKVGLLRVGDSMALDVVRDGVPRTVMATIEHEAAAPASAATTAATVPLLAGASFQALPPDEDGEGGVLVSDVVPGSPAARAGLRPGDVIVAVNREPVATPEALLDIARQNSSRMSLSVVRGNTRVFILIG